MKYIGIGFTAIAFVAGIAILLAFPTMWFVNYLIPPKVLVAVFGIEQLTVWKALALNFVLGLFRCSTIVNSKHE